MGAPPPELTVRAATAADRPALEDLLVRSWLTTWAPHLPADAVARFHDQAPVARYVRTALPRLEVAAAEGHLLGVLHVDGAELVTLEVEPTWKRRGVGSALLARAEARGARTLTVRAFNDAAIAFYAHHGWRRVATFEDTELGVPTLTHHYARPPAAGAHRAVNADRRDRA